MTEETAAMGDIIVAEPRSWGDCEAVAAWLDHLRHGRWDDAARHVSDDLTIESPPSLPHGGRHPSVPAAGGGRTLRAYAETFARTWQLDTSTAHEVSEAGDDVVHVHTTGTATARATGRCLALDVRTLIFLRDGRIELVRSYWRDTVEALHCLQP
jgi:ketosteroid isomerase-like protein